MVRRRGTCSYGRRSRSAISRPPSPPLASLRAHGPTLLSYLFPDIDGTTASARQEIAKFRVNADAGETIQLINWERVHRLPDHVRFVHEAHIRALTAMDVSDRSSAEKVQRACSVCHGDIANATVVKPKRFQSMKMGTCLDCHRFLTLARDDGYAVPELTDIPTDCTVCHK